MLKTRILSALLTGALLLSNLPSVYAAIESPGGSNDVPTIVDAEQAHFSVTVPTILPIDVSSDGVVTTADDVKIVNNSAGPVVVTGLSVDPQNSWSLVDYDTDFGSGKVNEKKLGLVLQGNEVQTDGSCGLSGFSSIAGGSSIDFTYDANVAVQTQSISSETVANVVFTVGWDSATPPIEPEEEFTVTYIAGENGSVNELSRSFKSGAYITFPDTTPSEGYVFDKWVDNDTELDVTGSTTVNADMTVKALFMPKIDESEVGKYYVFYDDTQATGGWRVELKPNFEKALSQNIPYENWNPNEPLPVLPAVYKGKPVTNYTSMFGGMYGYHKNITSLDLSNFDTKNVISMAGMFSYCESLTSLNLDGFDTRNVQTMAQMFFNCKKLSHLDVSNWNTSKVTNMSKLFEECRELTSLNLTNWDTSCVTNMYCMFYRCTNLKYLDITNFDTSNVTDMGAMFSYTGSGLIDILDFSNFSTSNVTNMSGMFSGCIINHLDVTNFDTRNVENMQSMFQYSRINTDLDLSSFDTSNINNVNDMFYMCELRGKAYGRTQEDCALFNSSRYKPTHINFEVKPI